MSTWSVSADVCFNPNFQHFYYSCPVKNMTFFVCVLNDWVWLVENSKKQTNLGLDGRNTWVYIEVIPLIFLFFFLYCSYLALKNPFFHNFIRTPFWSVMEHAVQALLGLEKLHSAMAVLKGVAHRFGLSIDPSWFMQSCGFWEEIVIKSSSIGCSTGRQRCAASFPVWAVSVSPSKLGELEMAGRVHSAVCCQRSALISTLS